MVIILSILIAAFFALFGMFIVRAIKPKKIDLYDRLNANAYQIKEKPDESYFSKLQKQLNMANVGITIPVYFMIMLVTAAIIFIITNFLVSSYGIAAIAACSAAFFPRLIVKYLVDRRTDEFDLMFIKALKRLAASIRAGESLEQAIQDVVDSESMPQVIREEFKTCLSDYTFTGDIAKSFTGIYERTGDKDVMGVAVGITIANKLGSDLAKIFDSYSQAIMARKEMEAEGKANLMSTRMDTLIISIVPFAFGAAMKFMQPDYFDYAFNWLNGLGRYIIVAFYAIVVYGVIYLMGKCNIKL